MSTWKSVLSIVIVLGSTVVWGGQSPAPTDESMPNLQAMHPSHRALYFVVRRGTEWLLQAQQGNGMFQPGLNVAINAPVESTHYYHQVEAALALAKVSRLTADARCNVAAQQACLTLLSSTKVDPQDGAIRYTVFPEMTVNRTGSAGLLLRAVHELTAPAEVRLQEAEGLAGYLKTCQQGDGSFRMSPAAIQTVAHDASTEMMTWRYEGMAVEGLALSLMHRPAEWKTQMLQKAAQHYGQQGKTIPLAAYPAFITGFAEVYLRTQDKACAAAVFNMADAVCNAQMGPEKGRIAWVGGFALNSEKNRPEPPTADSARFVTCLCDAYRLARQTGDVARTDKYRLAIEKGVQFLGSLQYTVGNSAHFAEAFQPRVVGGFRSSPQEGLIRLQDTAQCTLAIATYLTDVAGVPLAPAQARPVPPPVSK